MVPYGFWGYVRIETHSISLVMGNHDVVVSHILKCLLDLLSVIYGDFSSGMLNWWYAWACMDLVGAGYVAYNIKSWSVW